VWAFWPSEPYLEASAKLYGTYRYRSHERNLHLIAASVEELSPEDSQIIDLCFGSSEQLEVLAGRRRLPLLAVLKRREAMAQPRMEFLECGKIERIWLVGSNQLADLPSQS
jgi:hypothetical protein